MKALILDKDGTIFPYTLWIEPIRECLKESLPLKRFNEEKKAQIVSSFLSVLSVKDGTIGSDSLLYDRKKRLKGILKLVALTIKYRLNPIKSAKGFLKIKRRIEYGGEDVLSSYDFTSVIDTLKELRKNGIIVALFTNDSPRSVKTLEDRLGFKFDYSVDSSSRIRKPNKFSILIFSTMMKIEPLDIVFLSDTIEDLRMARKAGCGKVVAIDSSIERERLIPHSNDVIKEFSEIEKFLV